MIGLRAYNRAFSPCLLGAPELGRGSGKAVMSLQRTGVLEALVLLCLAAGSVEAAAQAIDAPPTDPASLSVDLAEPGAPGQPASISEPPLPSEEGWGAPRAGGDEGADAALRVAGEPTPDALEPGGPGGLEAPGPMGDGAGSGWLADPHQGDAFPSHLRLSGMELPQVSPQLLALQKELAGLPLEIAPSPATEFGSLLTELAGAGLFFGGISFFTAFNEQEQALYLVLIAASAVALPIGAITWAVGAFIDGNRRRSLERRRHRLQRAIDEELGLYPHG